MYHIELAVEYHIEQRKAIGGRLMPSLRPMIYLSLYFSYRHRRTQFASIGKIRSCLSDIS